jgi:hypothetical protein
MRYTSEEQVLELRKEIQKLYDEAKAKKRTLQAQENKDVFGLATATAKVDAYGDCLHLLAVMLEFTIEVDIEVV